jgi:hypothetical protein
MNDPFRRMRTAPRIGFARRLRRLSCRLARLVTSWPVDARFEVPRRRPPLYASAMAIAVAVALAFLLVGGALAAIFLFSPHAVLRITTGPDGGQARRPICAPAPTRWSRARSISP